MRKIIFKDPDKTRTSKTKPWLGWLTFCMLILVGQMGFAQTTGTIQIGSGTGTNNNIPIASWVYNYNQQIVTAAEYAAGGGSTGNITKIRYKATNVGTVSVWNNWTVYIGNTAKTAFTSTTDWVPLAELMPVFSGVITPDPVNNAWFEITFTVPFNYTGGNIVVAIDENTLGWQSAPTFSSYTSTTNSGIYYRNDSTNPNPASPPTASGRTATVPQIQFEGTLPSCVMPSTLSAINITHNSADLTWAGSGSNFDIEWGTQGFPKGTGTTVSGVSPYTLGGLSANTSLSYYVRQNCGGGDYSTWAGPYSFKTSCVAGTIPFFEGFETGYTHNTALGNCWSQQDIAGTQNWMVNSTNTNYNRTPKSGSFNTTLQYGNTDWIFYPLDLTGGVAYELKFYARQDVTSGASIEAAYGSANTAAAMVNSIIATSAVTNGDYQEFSGFFTPATNGVYYVGIKATLNFSPWHISLDDISVVEAPNCLQPTSLIGSNPTLTSIDLSWNGNGGATGNYEIKWGTPGFDINTATAIPVTGLSHTLNSTGGNYEFVVREICSVNDASAWSSRKAFRIPNVGEDCSAPIVMGALPYTTTDDTANYTDNPNIEGSPGASGCGTTGGYLNGNDVVYAYTASFDGVISVQLSELTDTWSGIFAYANCADIGVACIGSAFGSGATDRGFEMNVTSGSTYYFVISTNAAPQTVGYTLDVSQVLCPKPTGVAHTDVTHNSANVSWDVLGNYEINWGTGTFVAGEGANTDTVNATTEIAFSGLNGNTSYRYFVRQNCGGTSGDSEWSGPYTFTTLVAPASIPWMEGFTTTTIPTGWAQTGFLFGVATGITNAPGGVEGNVIYKNLWSSATSGNFQTIRIGTVSSGDILSFIYKTHNYSSPYAPPAVNSGNFIVAISTDNGVNYTNIQTITNDGVSEGWQDFEYDLSSYEGEYVRIRISATRTAGDYYLAFDNFYVGQPITCEVPTALTASNITANTTDLSWTSEGSTFDISWGTGAFDAEDGTIVSLANGGTLSGLTAQTTYQYYVRQNCGVGDVSMWVGPFGFTTACEAFDLPYSQDFEGVTAPSLPSCTSIETLNGNPWRTSSSAVTGMTGNKLNYSYHASGTGTANAWFYTPGLNLEAGKNYAISYKYGNNSTSWTERMKVAYGTSAMASVMNEVLADHNAINSTGVSENEVFFTVAEDGVYYFGFQSYSIANQNQLYVDDILIRELGDECTGTPDAGIATISEDSGISGSAVNFAVTGYENETEGLTYDWEYSVDNGVTWNSTGASDNEVTFTITGTIGTVFQVRYAVTCSFSESTGYSNELTFTVTQPLNYCAPTYVYAGDRLSVVNTTGATSNLNYTSGTGGQHFDMTTMILETTPGQQFTLNTTYVGGEQTVGVWIDWEHNNTFDDLGNRIDIKHSTLAGKSFIITIPSDATLGDYRLRVRGSYSNHVADGDAFACNSKSYGSSIDFTIRVAAPCSAEWTGAVSTDWNTAGNWCDNTVPTAGSDVVINVANAAVISTDVSIASITLGATANVTVNGSLNVGDISVAAGGSLIVANDANLFQSETAVNSGNIIVKRNTVIKHLDYTIWSSPVMGQGLQAFSPNTLASRIYDYNTTTDTWQITTGNFIAGKGVMFRAPNLFDDGYYPNAYTYVGEFNGVPNNGDVTMNFSSVGTYQGVGNPYPSNMDIEEFWMNNPGTGTLYFWTNTNAWDNNAGAYVANNWATYSDLGGLPAANSTKEPDSSVPVGQGFVVEATGLNSVSFNNDMRTAQSGVFFRTAASDKHRLWLNLSDTSNELNNLLIGYMNGATQGEDLRIDSKMFNYEGSALYSLIDGSQSAYVIQGRSLPFDDFDVVPLGFRAATSSSFTISLANFDGLFAQGQDIFLKDNLTQTQHNLKDGAYTFVSAQGEFTTRFEVVYRSSMDVNVPELDNAWVVYAKDKTFFIETQGFDMKEVVMYDMLGRVVYQSKAEGNSHTIAQEGANQVLIIKVITADNQVLTKKVNN